MASCGVREIEVRNKWVELTQVALSFGQLHVGFESAKSGYTILLGWLLFIGGKSRSRIDSSGSIRMRACVPCSPCTLSGPYCTTAKWNACILVVSRCVDLQGVIVRDWLKPAGDRVAILSSPSQSVGSVRFFDVGFRTENV